MKHLLKVGAAWISIVYVICFVGVALFPGLRGGFMKYGLHTAFSIGQNMLSFGTFLSGLIIWNIIAIASLWLFVQLFNSIKK